MLIGNDKQKVAVGLSPPPTLYDIDCLELNRTLWPDGLKGCNWCWEKQQENVTGLDLMTAANYNSMLVRPDE